MNKDYSKLEEEIGYIFNNKQLLVDALTHSSYIYEHNYEERVCNERLEFLGDAVLELVTSEFLYKNYPDTNEGDMSKRRASLVCEESLAFDCSQFNLGDFLYLGRGEIMNGGRTRASITSDACEALIGAIYLDGGFTNAKEFIEKYILNDIERKGLFYDSKTTLQEVTQERFRTSPVYELTLESGPDHNKHFEYIVKINDVIYGKGKGKSKKSAQQSAAYDALIKLKEQK